MESGFYSRNDVFEPHLSYGHSNAHTCQLNVKVSLEPAFRDCLVKSVSDWECLWEAPPQERAAEPQ